jgi:hypothetical protein
MHRKQRASNRKTRGQRSQERLVRIGQRTPRVGEACLCNGVPATSTVSRKYAVLVIPTDRNATGTPHQPDTLRRLRTVADDVSKADGRIDITSIEITQHFLKRDAITVNV